MKKLIMTIVGVAISVIIVAACLMPILSDAVKTEDKFTNDGYYTYDPVGDDTDVTIVWDGNTPDVLTIGDVVLTMPTGNGNWTIVGSENFTLRFYRSASTTGMQCYGVGGYFAINLSNSTGGSVAVTQSSIVLLRSDEGTKTYTMGSHGFVINPAGDGPLTLKYSNESAFVLDDSEIYLCGTTYVTGSGTNDFVGVFGYGNVEGVTLSAFYGNTGSNTVSFGTPTINATAVDTHIDLFKISDVTFDLTQNSATVTAIYSYFVVPTEVTAERAVHFTPEQIAIFSAIPLLIIVAILLMAVSIINKGRE